MATVTAEVGMVLIELPTLTNGMALVTHLEDNRVHGHKHNFSRSFVCKLLQLKLSLNNHSGLPVCSPLICPMCKSITRDSIGWNLGPQILDLEH